MMFVGKEESLTLKSLSNLALVADPCFRHEANDWCSSWIPYHDLRLE